MNFKYPHLFSILIPCFFTLISCQREVKVFLPLPNPNDGTLTAPVNTSVTGLVVDENNSPMPGVMVKATNTYNSVSDNKRHFTFDNITFDMYTSVITAEATGYFKSYRIFSASTKGLNFVKIQLLKKLLPELLMQVRVDLYQLQNILLSFRPGELLIKIPMGYTMALLQFMHTTLIQSPIIYLQ